MFVRLCGLLMGVFGLAIACGGKAVYEVEGEFESDVVPGAGATGGNSSRPTAGDAGRPVPKPSVDPGMPDVITDPDSCVNWGSGSATICEVGRDCVDGTRVSAQCRLVDGVARCLCWEGGVTVRNVLRVGGAFGAACDTAFELCNFE